jgi:hypothetical protein
MHDSIDEIEPNLPDSETLLHSLSLIVKGGRPALAHIWHGVTCTVYWQPMFSRSSFPYKVEVDIYLNASDFGKVDDAYKGQIIEWTEALVRQSCHDAKSVEVRVNPRLECPSGQKDSGINNNCFFETKSVVEHDGLQFRSRTETRIYDELKRRRVLFFPLPAAILGGKNSEQKREPDFLVCQGGKWGVLEVMGDQYHTPQNAPRDHDRAREFSDYGVFMIQFYDASRCYNNTKEVVDDFLIRLANFKA